MFYINYKEGKTTHTVKEFASKELAEINLPSMGEDHEYYVSSRCTKDWREKKAEDAAMAELENEIEEAPEQKGDKYTTLDELLDAEAEVDPDEDYVDVDENPEVADEEEFEEEEDEELA